MREYIANLAKHVFVVSTGFAALLHSTWSLATLFNGNEPPRPLSADWLAWVIPAFALAFAIDAGQIATSVELRSGERAIAKYATFATLAVATYYLQWFYLVAHVPLIQLAPGVAAEHQAAATWLRNAAIWVIPGLLPVATLLYTFSYAAPRKAGVRPVASRPAATPAQTPRTTPVEVASAPRAELPGASVADVPALVAGEAVLFTMVCADCGRTFDKATQVGAQNALNAHRRHAHPASAER